MNTAMILIRLRIILLSIWQATRLPYNSLHPVAAPFRVRVSNSPRRLKPATTITDTAVPASIRGLGAAEFAFFHPREVGADLFAEFLDRMIGAALHQRVVDGAAGLVLGDPFLREHAALDFAEDFLHLGAGLLGDDAFAAGDVAVLRGVADREAHAADARFVDEIDDEFHFMQTFKISHLGSVTGFDERLETRKDQFRATAAEDGLFAEQIGLGFFANRGLEDRGASGADTLGPRERDLLGFAGGVLMDRDERRNTFALGVHAADEMTGPFRGDEKYIDILGRDDLAEMQRETVRDAERLAFFQVRRDVAAVGLAMARVGDRHHDHVGLLRRVGDRKNFETLLFGTLGGLAALIE